MILMVLVLYSKLNFICANSILFSLNYFPLEGILAERLFSTFDKDKNNVIDYEEFLGKFVITIPIRVEFCLRGEFCWFYLIFQTCLVSKFIENAL